jgi:hypothetical protein
MGMMRTNYSTFSAAYYSPEVNTTGLPLRVCDGALIPDTEILPTVNHDLYVIGDKISYNQNARLIIPRFADPVFEFAGFISVVFEQIQVEFNETLFVVRGTADLTLTDFRCWYGNTCVMVKTDIAPGIGLMVTDGVFAFNGIAVKRFSGMVTLLHCTIYDMRIAGIVVTSSDLGNIFEYGTHFFNVLHPFATQGGSGIYAPVSDIDITDQDVMTQFIAQGRTYPSACPACICNDTLGTSGSSTSCNNDVSTSDHIVRIFFVVLVALLVTIPVLVYVRLSKRKYNDTIQ